MIIRRRFPPADFFDLDVAPISRAIIGRARITARALVQFLHKKYPPVHDTP
jgi:hypothetical protein